MNQGTLQSLLVEDADKKRLEELRAFVIYHNHRYHTLDAPEITDDEYNAAFQELLRLEERHPEWRSPDSPTNRIGGQVLSSLETKAHTRRMYSLDNVFDAEEWPVSPAPAFPFLRLRRCTGSQKAWQAAY